MKVFVLLEDFSTFRGVFKSIESATDYIESKGGCIIGSDTMDDITYVSVDYPAEDCSNTFRIIEQKVK